MAVAMRIGPWAAEAPSTALRAVPLPLWERIFTSGAAAIPPPLGEGDREAVEGAAWR